MYTNFANSILIDWVVRTSAFSNKRFLDWTKLNRSTKTNKLYTNSSINFVLSTSFFCVLNFQVIPSSRIFPHLNRVFKTNHIMNELKKMSKRWEHIRRISQSKQFIFSMMWKRKKSRRQRIVILDKSEKNSMMLTFSLLALGLRIREYVCVRKVAC